MSCHDIPTPEFTHSQNAAELWSGAGQEDGQNAEVSLYFIDIIHYLLGMQAQPTGLGRRRCWRKSCTARGCIKRERTCSALATCADSVSAVAKRRP